jgi:ABC-type antimicrobial peptide transport system permease subunit
MLATAGLYAVVSFLVTSRLTEIAVRMALGANSGNVLAMVLRQALTMTVIGGVIGAASALAIGRVIQAEMHAAPGTDFKALLAALAALLTATLVAASIPSIRAARVNPVALLKEQ